MSTSSLNFQTLGAGGITQLTGDVTAGPGGASQAATVANDAVTYAKMQNVSAASKLLGRGDSGSGDVQEITLGANLTMTGTTLAASGGGGSWTRISAATLTRVTGTAPTTLGEYRSYRRNASAFSFTETSADPAVAPTSANGFFIYATGNGSGFTTADSANEPSKYEIFIGTNKVFQIQAYSTTGRSGVVGIDEHYINNTFKLGLLKHYDPNTGILTISNIFLPSAVTSTACGTDASGNTVQDIFFDILYQ